MLFEIWVTSAAFPVCACDITFLFNIWHDKVVDTGNFWNYRSLFYTLVFGLLILQQQNASTSLPEARTKSTLLGPLEFLIGWSGWKFLLLQSRPFFVFPGILDQVGLFSFVVALFSGYTVYKLEPEMKWNHPPSHDLCQFSQEQEEQRAKVRYTMNLPKCEGPTGVELGSAYGHAWKSRPCH